MKSGCAFLCDDVLGRNCILDVFAGSGLLRILAAASTVSVTFSGGDCLPNSQVWEAVCQFGE